MSTSNHLFIQLSRYAPDDINTDEKKQDVFLIVLNDDIQFQLLNTDYADFQHMVDKAIVIENKIREMEKDGKRKVPFSGQSSRSNVRPRFLQPNQFFKPLQMNCTTSAECKTVITAVLMVMSSMDPHMISGHMGMGCGYVLVGLCQSGFY
jgi:hypothetical protein